METHSINETCDFYALKEYISDNKYTYISKESPSFKKLLNKDFIDYLEFNFEDHEKFIVTLLNEKVQQEACDWLKNFLPEEENLDDIIFGKNKIERIVSCEPIDTGMELFIQDDKGRISSKIIPNEYWLLSYQRHDNTWQKLKGDLYYRFIKKFTNREDWLSERSLLRKKAFSIWNDKEAAMVLNGFTYFKDLKPEELSVLSFDIETTTLEHNHQAKVLLISNTFRDSQGRITKKLFAYDDYKNQEEMIDDWSRWVRQNDPSILTGHNIFGFDLPYMAYISDGNLAIGRDHSNIVFDEYDSRFRKDGSQTYPYRKAHCYGREIVDTMFLAYKYDFSRKYDSYGLKKIIAYEIEDGKFSLSKEKQISPIVNELIIRSNDRQFYDASQIKYNYKDLDEWKKIKKYCEDDSDDALSLFDLMSTSIFYMARSIPKSFQEITCSATGSQINSMMIRGYLQNGYSIPNSSDPKDYIGAISFGQPGIFFNVQKIDVASLYPSIIMQYGLYDRFKDPNAHFLKMVTYFTKERLNYKKLYKDTKDSYYKDLSESFKIIANSAYGFMGTPGLHYNSPLSAEFITKKGREILENSINWAKENGFNVVNGDTDSISISYNDASYIEKEDREEILRCINSLMPEKIRFEDDGYFSSFVIVKAKNYCMVKEDGEVKIKGSALKGTAKPKALQKYIEDIIHILIKGGKEKELLELYHKNINDVLNLKDITSWCKKVTITDKVLNPERTNEQKVNDALEGEEDIQEGNKVYMYFREDKTLNLCDRWDKDKPDHDKYKLIEMLYKSTSVFNTIVDIKQFEKYHLKTKRKFLDNIITK